MGTDTVYFTSDSVLGPGEYIFQDQTGRCRKVVVGEDGTATAATHTARAIREQGTAPENYVYRYIFSNSSPREEAQTTRRVGRNAFKKFCQPKRRLE